MIPSIIMICLPDPMRANLHLSLTRNDSPPIYHLWMATLLNRAIIYHDDANLSIAAVTIQSETLPTSGLDCGLAVNHL